VIIATLGMATVVPAAPFPEWQDEAKPRTTSGTHHCIEEYS
jgi:hypothetical protein